MLLGQQARLITAVENMAAVIDRLRTESLSGNGKNSHLSSLRSSHVNTDQDGEVNFDLTATLELYAPSRLSDGEASDDDHARDDERTHTHGDGGRSKKRRLNKRQSDEIAHQGGPLSAQIAKNDGSVSETSLSTHGALAASIQEHERGLTNEDCGLPRSQDVVYSGGAIGSLNGDVRSEDPYVSFMEMLQNVGKGPAAPHARYGGIPDTMSTGTNGRAVEAFNLQSVPQSLPIIQDRAGLVYDDSQMLPLIDMVDWDASLMSCTDLFSAPYNDSQWTS